MPFFLDLHFEMQSALEEAEQDEQDLNKEKHFI
jgi:hypothetical protein